jgi:hypothetical protein
MNNFNRAHCAGQAARQPNFAISAPSDHTQHFVIGDERYLRGDVVRDGADFTQAPRAKQFLEGDAPSRPIRRSRPSVTLHLLERFNFFLQQRGNAVTREINLADVHI